MHVSVPCRRKRPRKEKPGQGTGLGGTQENAQYKIKPVRETGLDNSRCHAGKPFCSGVFEDDGTGGFPVLMCCYRLAVQIKRRETGIWEHKKGSKRKRQDDGSYGTAQQRKRGTK